MNRRDFTRISALSASGIAVWPTLFDKIRVSNPGVDKIYLIHFTHCDYGFTDHPVTNMEQHVEFLRLAMQFCEETSEYSKESQFHWTVEGMWTLENFWNEASLMEKRRFDKLFANGQIEVTAMPANMTMLPSPYEWENELNRLKFFYNTYQPKVVMQNDVNGIPWGMIPSFLEHGFEYIWMGINEYGSKAPRKAPSLWLWEGPDSNKILTWLAFHYGAGFDFFHKEWWRRGPVPPAHNVWYNPPSGSETFANSSTAIEESVKLTEKKIESLVRNNYPYNILAISVTNMWRCDNDPPCRQISEFVETWNSTGRKPELIFTTPSQFFRNLEPVSKGKIETIRGDWSDWWADGLASMPQQIAVLQDAKRRNEDLERAAQKLNSGIAGGKEKLELLNHRLVFGMEHTYDGYASVAYPYQELTMSNEHHRFGIMYEAQERTKVLKALLIRNSPDYMPFSQTRFIEVLNPGKLPRSGWVTISGNALRIDVNAAKDLKSGEIFPFEPVMGYDWSEPVENTKRPLEFPDNVWGQVVTDYRFFLKNLQPGGKRKFVLIKTSETNKRTTSLLDLSTGDDKNPFGQLTIEKDGLQIFDEKARYFPGQLIVEKPQGFKNRSFIENRKANLLEIDYSNPLLIKSDSSEGLYATKKTLTFKHDIARAIIQDIELIDGLGRLDITTTIWLKEQLDPLAIYMVFPFSKQEELPRYFSFGFPTRAGADQMPGTCGEFSVIQNGVFWEDGRHNLILDTPDNPLAVFGKLSTRNLQEVFIPENSHIFSIICNNYWVTNFPILRPAKLVLRHTIEVRDKNVVPLPDSGFELWAYPVK